MALFVVTTAGGWIFERMGSPLPWMIGPMLFAAAIFLWGRFDVTVPVAIRPLGQVIVGCQVGLSITPDALPLLRLAPWMIATALLTAGGIFLASLVLARASGRAVSQVFLGAIPTSPVEAAAMAMKAGVNPVPVILSQTLRLAATVLILPFAMYALGGWPEVGRQPVRIEAFDPVNVLLLASLGIGGMMLFRLLRIPNPNFLGPIAVSVLLAATGHAPDPFPALLLAAAQVVLGTWLGSTFRRDVLVAAGRLTFFCIASALVVISVCTLCALFISWGSGIDWHAMVLAAAPGGVVEMALTARFLEQNVVLITTFHLTRIFIIMPNVPWVVALISRYEARHNQHGDSS